MIRLIYKGYKKRIQKNRFKKIFEKNSNNLSFETMSFLDKMNINILYSPKIQEKKYLFCYKIMFAILHNGINFFNFLKSFS